jgi:L-asparagine oxygenase
MNMTMFAHRQPPIVEAGGWSARLTPETTIAGVSEALICAAGYAAQTLPAAVFRALADFTVDAGQTGALLIKGINVGQLPSTPSTPESCSAFDPSEKSSQEFPLKTLQSEMALLTVARALGQPVGYLPELGGDVVQNIVPVQASAGRQVSTSSKVELMFHTEAAFHPHRPRYLLLLCLKGDSNATTTLSSIREVIHLLDERTIEVLRQPRFRTAPDESYLNDPTGPRLLGAPIAVFSGHHGTQGFSDHQGNSGAPTLVFDADLMVGIDDEADAALRTLGAVVAAHHTGVVLEAGDLLVIDNTVAVHGRSSFTPRFDGTDRWLQRTFVVADLAASARDRVGRVIATRFD